MKFLSFEPVFHKVLAQKLIHISEDIAKAFSIIISNNSNNEAKKRIFAKYASRITQVTRLND